MSAPTPIRVGFLITAYHQPEQLSRLINLLGRAYNYSDIFVHLDKKSLVAPAGIRNATDGSVHILQRHCVYWGGFNQLLSILSLIDAAILHRHYDFLVLLSGQDMPVVPAEELTAFLAQHRGECFLDCFELPFDGWHYQGGMGRVEWFWFMDHATRVRGVQRGQTLLQAAFKRMGLRRRGSSMFKFYGGSDWWILPGSAAKHCVDEFSADARIRSVFKYSFIPSEMFFQTVLMGSEFRPRVMGNNRRYIRWASANGGHPDVVDMSHIEDIRRSGALFARKFDLQSSKGAFEYFERQFSERAAVCAQGLV